MVDTPPLTILNSRAMEKNAKIYVAGHRGLVGSAITEALQKKGYENLIFRTHAELDLRDSAAVASFFETEKPEYVFPRCSTCRWYRRQQCV